MRLNLVTGSSCKLAATSCQPISGGRQGCTTRNLHTCAHINPGSGPCHGVAPDHICRTLSVARHLQAVITTTTLLSHWIKCHITVHATCFTPTVNNQAFLGSYSSTHGLFQSALLHLNAAHTTDHDKAASQVTHRAYKLHLVRLGPSAQWLSDLLSRGGAELCYCR